MLGDRNSNHVFESAKFYALYNWAMASSVIPVFKAKYKLCSSLPLLLGQISNLQLVRLLAPVTAIRYQPVYSSTGESLYDPEWLPFLDTPARSRLTFRPFRLRW